MILYTRPSITSCQGPSALSAKLSVALMRVWVVRKLNLEAVGWNEARGVERIGLVRPRLRAGRARSPKGASGRTRSRWNCASTATTAAGGASPPQTKTQVFLDRFGVQGDPLVLDSVSFELQPSQRLLARDCTPMSQVVTRLHVDRKDIALLGFVQCDDDRGDGVLRGARIEDVCHDGPQLCLLGGIRPRGTDVDDASVRAVCHMNLRGRSPKQISVRFSEWEERKESAAAARARYARSAFEPRAVLPGRFRRRHARRLGPCEAR